MRAERRPGLQRPNVGRLFDDDVISFVEEKPCDEIKPLLRTADQQNVLGGDGDASLTVQPGDLVAQAGVALGWSVLQGGTTLFPEHFLSCHGSGFQRERFRGRNAASK